MLLRVLGPVQIESDDGSVHTLGRRQERCALAVLLLHVGYVVTVDRLCDLLWDDPPAQARRAVHSHAARIRAALVRVGAEAVGIELVGSGDGYLLRADPQNIDVHRFRALVEQAGTAELVRRDTLLREALSLWRGPALHQAATSDRIRQGLCADLEEQRVRALEESIATGLDLGRHRELVPDLARLTAEHPTRERLFELYMIALYGSDRTADALDTYHRIRTRLAEELGLEPSRGLRDLQRAILRGTPVGAVDRNAAPPVRAGVPRPALLPPDQAGFTGRAGYLRSLDRVLAVAADAPGTAVVISAIAGTAGVGKTALAVHWSHRVRDRFPDGQLYVNLRGHASAPPLRPIDALTGFLTALDVATDRVPVDLDHATGLYRSLLADRRMLILLDNAATVDQVRPLLPAARGCLVLITSRNRLGGLVARDGARPLSLDVLTADEAYALLAGVLGDDRVATEPEAVAELGRLCAHLPLALRIAAASLSENLDRRIADYVEELRTADRLSALAVAGDDDTAVRTTFDLSYTALPADARRLFRRLGLVPGVDVTIPAAAALAGTAPELVASTLDRLAAAHLLLQVAPGRYTCHDLLRCYAAEKVRGDDEADRIAATRRLYDYYIATVDAAVDLLKPGLVRLTREPHDPGTRAVRFDDGAQALAWLDAERPNLVAAVTAAAEGGPLPAAWQLADAMRGYFWLRVVLPDWLAVSAAGLAAAKVDGDAAAQSAGHLNVGDALTRQGSSRDALDHYALARHGYELAGVEEGQAAVSNNLGITHALLGEGAQAVEHFHEALRIRRRLGQPLSEAGALLNLAAVLYPLGQVAAAADHAAQAVAVYEKTGSQQGLGVALCSLGGSRLTLGYSSEAQELLGRALQFSRESGDRNTEAEALILSAVAYRDAGRYAEALACAEEAGTIAAETSGQHLVADSLITRGIICQRMRRVEEAFQHLRQALDLARTIESPPAEGEALLALGATYLDLPDVDQARQHAESAYAVAHRAGHQLREGQALGLLADVELAAGRPDDAVRQGHAAMEILTQTGYRLGQAQVHVTLADALHRLSRTDEERQHRRRAEALFTDIGVCSTTAGATSPPLRV